MLRNMDFFYPGNTLLRGWNNFLGGASNNRSNIYNVTGGSPFGAGLAWMKTWLQTNSRAVLSQQLCPSLLSSGFFNVTGMSRVGSFDPQWVSTTFLNSMQQYSYSADDKPEFVFFQIRQGPFLSNDRPHRL